MAQPLYRREGGRGGGRRMGLRHVTPLPSWKDWVATSKEGLESKEPSGGRSAILWFSCRSKGMGSAFLEVPFDRLLGSEPFSLGGRKG